MLVSGEEAGWCPSVLNCFQDRSKYQNYNTPGLLQVAIALFFANASMNIIATGNYKTAYIHLHRGIPRHAMVDKQGAGVKVTNRPAHATVRDVLSGLVKNSLSPYLIG